MFSSLGLFQEVPCPERQTCRRPRCIFSHRTDLPPAPALNIPIHEPSQQPVASTSQIQPAGPSSRPMTIPSKRAIVNQHRVASPSNNGSPTSEPPRKLQKTGSVQKPVAVPTSRQTSSGVPLLRVNAAQSRVAVPVRQAMLKTLYEHYTVLYSKIESLDPNLAAEHSLKQEEEVYNKSNKLTYRNAIINSVAALKRRELPDSISHPSVGTQEDVIARAEARKSLDALRITRAHLDRLVMSMDIMQRWGYVVEIPEGPGGDRPSQEGKTAKCERCAQPYMVKRKEEAEECVHHWGRPQVRKIAGGERIRVYSCCSRPATGDDGCSKGPHVFYEKSPVDLHARHAFSHTRPAAGDASDTALDVAALDCEMVYTTGGMRVARVSVVDGAGKEILDEFVVMDEGVEIIDYNTRFSGITPENHAQAVLPLAAIRRSLDAYINADTILIGHALDNDLNTLRIIHHRCVDTAILFPHRGGPPYRRALRDLVKEHLGTSIQQGGGTVGHSSVEDSVATLDLVRWYILNKPQPTSQPAAPSKVDEAASSMAIDASA
ncbi:hypothetical protein PLICRDRAFT_149506 [Plicaturopsis crispa FD-325 SS-3]|nr:hypothetical protein PLICRDRAFT_149506 [Plicaturopsis crispa FD-325 SS-3]